MKEEEFKIIHKKRIRRAKAPKKPQLTEEERQFINEHRINWNL